MYASGAAPGRKTSATGFSSRQNSFAMDAPSHRLRIREITVSRRHTWHKVRASGVRADRPGSANLAPMNATPPESRSSSYAAAGVDEEREQVAFARVMRPWLARTKVKSPLVTSITGLASGYFATLM